MGSFQTEQQLGTGDVESRPRAWRGRSAAAGIAGSVIASLCCLPAAAAIALGLGLGTVAGLSQLLAYQRFFQVGGLAFAGLAVWWLTRRRGASCYLAGHERERVPLLVLGAFALSFAILNIGVIPMLEGRT